MLVLEPIFEQSGSSSEVASDPVVGANLPAFNPTGKQRAGYRGVGASARGVELLAEVQTQGFGGAADNLGRLPAARNTR
jgi:hypothetical protein